MAPLSQYPSFADSCNIRNKLILPQIDFLVKKDIFYSFKIKNIPVVLSHKQDVHS